MATLRLCSVPGCGKPTRYKVFCNVHYARWRRHGDPLAGRVQEGEPLRYFLDVVVGYDGAECLFWPYGKSGGYGKLNVRGRSPATVSRLICEHANGPPPSPEYDAAHSCGNGHLGCVAKRHLSWKTRKGNVADAIAHGTHIRGERQGRSKLTETDVRKILALKGTMTQAKIAELMHVGQDHICRIHARKIWAWLSI